MITHCHRCEKPLTSFHKDRGISNGLMDFNRYRCTNYSCSGYSSAVSVDITYTSDNLKLVSYWFVFDKGICVSGSDTSFSATGYFLIGKILPQDLDGSFYEVVFEEDSYLDFDDISDLEDRANRFLKLKSFW